HAEHVEVHVNVGREVATAVVADDGRGFESTGSGNGDGDSHLGLEMLSDLASQAGANLVGSSKPGGGTRIELEVPVARATCCSPRTTPSFAVACCNCSETSTRSRWSAPHRAGRRQLRSRRSIGLTSC